MAKVRKTYGYTAFSHPLQFIRAIRLPGCNEMKTGGSQSSSLLLVYPS